MTPSTPARKPESESSSESATITNHEKYTKGDFEVISSDKVRFRVQSFHLFSAR